MTTYNEDTEADTLFSALAHASRRKMLDIVRDQPGITVGQLASQFDTSRITVINHLSLLTDAGLILSEKDGRSRKLYLNAAPIHAIQRRWIDAYGANWAEQTLTLKDMAEAAHLTRKDKT
ncbi:ArsR/SmtB family transcription factor [Pseudooceanicola onchidii]|uniref:ArsR/SmtB family transcription factor n=1 Tax=Pseudooceanicola onchidii TaxID=2562279 RepID=UPI0010AAA01B|nr:helix-turn-helix transcriptional regulator [Pseudooceanicola onchidii]